MAINRSKREGHSRGGWGEGDEMNFLLGSGELEEFSVGTIITEFVVFV